MDKPIWQKYSLPLIFLLIFLFSFSVPTAGAQTKTFYWQQFDADMTLLPNGDIRVTETQTLVFSGGSFTFGFRTIPTGVAGQNDGIEVLGLREGDRQFNQDFSTAPGTYKVLNIGDEVKIDWFFEPTEGKHTYTIDYLVRNPVIVGTAEEGDGDQIFWKPLPPDLLSSRVETSTVTLTLPEGVQPQQYINGDGFLVEGSINGDTDLVTTQVSDDGRVITFQSEVYIYSGDSFEIRTQIPHGALAIPTPEWQQQQQRNDTTQLGIIIVAVLLLIGGPLGVLALWYLFGRDPQLTVAVPEYISEPPSNLPPALVGTLIDEKANIHDIISTLVDLAQRGYLTIQEVGRSDHLFTQGEGDLSKLRSYETHFYNRIFRNKKERKLSSLKNKFYTDIPKLQTMLYDELVEAGYVPGSPQSIRNRFSVLAGLVIGVGVMALFGLSAILPEGVSSVGFCIAVPIGLSGALLMFVARHMPKKTAVGTEEAAKWKAFKTYLEQIEKYEDMEEASDLFEKYLPYATAFGIERSFIRKFSTLSSTPPPTWYYPMPGRHYGGMGRGTTAKTMPRGGSKEGSLPTLEGMSGSLTGGLAGMSAGLTRMLNSSTQVMQSAPASTSSGGSSGGFSGGGGFSSGGGGSAGFG